MLISLPQLSAAVVAKNQGTEGDLCWWKDTSWAWNADDGGEKGTGKEENKEKMVRQQLRRRRVTTNSVSSPIKIQQIDFYSITYWVNWTLANQFQ